MPNNRYRPRVTDVYLDAGMKGWIAGTAAINHWRVASWYSLSDLVQDGYVCYCVCRNRYTLLPATPPWPDLNTDTPTTEQRKHFMALVQRAYINHIVDLAKASSATLENPVSELALGDNLVDLDTLAEPLPEEISARLAVLQAPAEIGEAIVRIVNDGIEGANYLRSKLRVMDDGRVRKGRKALRETTSEYMTRVVGGDSALLDKTLNYLLS